MSAIDWREFRATQSSVELDGLSYLRLRVAYVDAGAGDAVVLLHGIPTWSFLWREAIPALAQMRRVIAPDFLGHGFSDRRDRFDRSLAAQTEMVCALLDTLGIERADVVGHDTGGGVALTMAVKRPERVRRLVLANVVCYDSWPIADMLALGDPQLREKAPEEIVEFVRSGLAPGVARPERRTPEFERGILAPYADEEGKLSLIRNAVSLNTNQTMELVDRHSEIRAPTLVLWGVEDPWQPIADGERLAAEIPDARLERLEGTSHWLQQDAPGRVAAAITDFLEATP
jgi:haloalkane dehalogenase